jgi:hypothetical protein
MGKIDATVPLAEWFATTAQCAALVRLLLSRHRTAGADRKLGNNLSAGSVALEKTPSGPAGQGLCRNREHFPPILGALCLRQGSELRPLRRPGRSLL